MVAASSLSALRAARGNLKGSLTKLSTFTENITELITLSNLEVRLERANDLWAKFYTSQQQMYEHKDEDGYVDPEEEFDEFEAKYIQVKAALLSAVRDRQKCTPDKNPTAPPTPAPNSQALCVQQVAANPPHDNSYLPKIHIEPFSGSYRDWPSFRDMFQSSVHNKTHLSPTEKFHFLRSCLRGEALNLLTHIPVSDATYEQAWDRIEKRYDRPRYIISSLVETLMQLPSVQASNIKTLRKISDGADEVIRGLNSLDSYERDPWIIYVLLSKLDPDTRQAWAAASVDEDYPAIVDFLNFLERRCEAFESCKGGPRENNKSKPVVLRSMHVSSTISCPKCNSSHALPECHEFLAMRVEARRDFVKSKKLCFNCLRGRHNASTCHSKFRCRSCNTRHHSLVHPTTQANSGTANRAVESAMVPTTWSNADTPSTSTNITPVITNHSCNYTSFSTQTLLPTAVGKVMDQFRNYQLVRILIDTGSQVSFVTESCVQKLGLRRTNARIPISGIGAISAGQSKGLVSMTIASRYDSASISVDTYILSRVTSALPTVSFDVKNWNHISNLNLADTSFNHSNPVDILLGADRAWDILEGDIIRSAEGHPIAHKTIFGWVLAGKLFSDRTQFNNSDSLMQTYHSILDIDAALQAFWTIEEVDPRSIASAEDKAIEQHFVKTHRRDDQGKYIVRLPFKHPPIFADTLGCAISRLKAMERKFLRNPELLQSYSRFMDEYLSLGHMERVPSSEVDNHNVFYLPHHAVFNPNSSTTKLRVVFDGSVQDSKGNSLNDSLMIGPPIQRDLFSVCVRFRRHTYVFTADIVKMFRQIWVAGDDTDYQRIVWRTSPTKPLEHFRLRTVTYGTSCAPYLSVRVLEQLACDYRENYPVASDIILNDFYVDDVVSGGDSLADVVFKRQRLIELLSKGGLKLSKWQSNCAELLPDGQIKSESVSIDSENDSWVKVLGLFWNSKLDTFSFRINLSADESNTKRQLLREVSRVFDPLGFLAPSVIQLKIILQELWHHKLTWDEPLPETIAAHWHKRRQELPILTQISVPRCIGLADANFQLHGFSDASASAYSAVIYARFVLPDGTIKTNIVAAKTRVAPLKQLTIPRLELCGALLLTRLLVAIQKALNLNCSNIFAFCDSQVVLSWLSSPPRRWDIFVGNRTAEILTTIPRSRWFHVRSDQNPADCASRGIAPSALINHPLWWTGPHWLTQHENTWPIIKIVEEHPDCKKEEKKQFAQSVLVVNHDHLLDFLSPRVSSWNRLIRITAFVFRFILKCRKRSQATTNFLLPNELYDAKHAIIQWLQNRCFGESLSFFKKHNCFPKSCKLGNLTPFLDDQQILRVGGRIQQAEIPFNVKHPIILPKAHNITKLIALDFHQRLLHPGVSTLFVHIRQEFWIIGCRNLLRKITHDCIKCFRQRKATAAQIMGNLPEPRINQSRPFTHCGCDYAGPILIKAKIGRRTHVTKGYIALFVCLSTKAIHLELVSDLTTNAFLAALRRFVARRGKPSHMYSDNGTNFRGSAKVLSDMQKLTLSEYHNAIVAESLAHDSITWHFIPPSAPHFGGLWEAGVKSVKQHLRRVIGLETLTFEQLYTLLTQIESLLNSRPLCKMSDQDIDPLTPAHFVIGQPFSAVPEPSSEIPQNRLLCWQAIQAKLHGFWKRWSMEYLTALQQRPKWLHTRRDFQLNDLVVIKDTNLPPGKWAMGRIILLHPGKDGHIRVVTLRTKHGEFVRPIHKLALLPIS